MSAVDERVVRMEFDNKQFEKNIKESIRSLDDLDKQLGLVSDEDAFDNIDKRSKKIDFSHLLGGLDKVSSGFTALEAIAVGALAKIGSKLVDVASKYAGFFTFQQIGAGWQKFAEYSNATQSTISAISDTWEKQATDTTRKEYLRELTGDAEDAMKLWEAVNDPSLTNAKNATQFSRNAKKIADSLHLEAIEFEAIYEDVWNMQNRFETAEEYVEKYVDTLNWYSDETSYNFTDMISTLGKFTAAGVKLEDASIAIQGMMNMVATAGGNAEVGQRVAYNLSQAMSAGSLKMIDWKSLQNANVATVEFKQHLLETAEQMKVIKKVSGEGADAVYKYGNMTFSATSNFESSLAKGWASSKVLQKTLEAYGKFSDGMHQVIEDFGDYDLYATGVFEDLDTYEAYMEAGEGSDAAAEWHRRLQDNFGDDKEAIAKYTEALDKMINDPDYDFGKKVFGDAQKARTFKDAIAATADAVSTKWASMFKFIFGTSERAKEFWSDFTETLYELFAEPLDNILKLFKRVKRDYQFFIENDKGQQEKVDAFEAFRRSLENLQEALLSIISPIREAFRAIFGEGAAEKIANLSKRFYEFTKSLLISKETAQNIKDAFTGFFKIIKSGFSIVGKVVKGVFNFIKPIFSLMGPIVKVLLSVAGVIGRVISSIAKLAEVKKALPFAEAMEKDAGIIAKACEWISEKLEALSKWLDETLDDEAIEQALIAVSGAFVTAFGAIKKAWEWIKNAAQAAWEVISPILTAMWDKVKELIPTWQEITEVFSTVWGWISKVASAIWDFIKPYIDQVIEALGKFATKISEFITGFINAGDKATYFKDNIKGIIDAFIEWKQNASFLKWLIDKFETVKTIIGKIKDYLSSKGQNGGANGEKTPFSAILYMLYNIGALLLILKIIKSIKNFAGLKTLFTNLTKAFQNVTGAIKKFSGLLNKIAIFVGLYMIMKALTDLVKVLKDFGQLSPGQIWNSVGAIIAIVAVLTGFAFAIKALIKNMDPKDIKSLLKVCLVLSVVLIAIAYALGQAANLPGGFAMMDRVLMIILLLGSIVGAAWLLSKFTDKVEWKTIILIVALAAVLFVAALAMKKIGDIPPDAFERAKSILLIIAGAVLIAMVVGAIIKSGAEAIKNIGIAVLAMAASLFLIVLALKFLKDVKMDMNMVGTLISIIAILIVLAAIPSAMAYFAKNNDLASKDIGKMAGVVVIMTACIAIIMWSISGLIKTVGKNNISGDQLQSIGVMLGLMVLALGTMALMLAKAVELVSGIEDGVNSISTIAKAIRTMSVSILIISAVLMLLMKMDVNWSNAWQPLTIILAIIVLLGGMAFALAGAAKLAGENPISAGPILAMAFAVILIVGALLIVNKALQGKEQQVWQAVGVMAVLMVLLSGLFVAIGGAQKLAGTEIDWKSIVSVMAGVIVIMKTLTEMTILTESSDLLKSAIAIAIVIAVLAGLFIAIGGMSKMIGGWSSMIQTIILMAAAVAAIWIVVSAMKSLSGVEGVWKNALAVGLLLTGLLIVVSLLTKLADGSGKGWSAMLQTVIMLAAIVGAIFVVAMAFQALNGVDISWKTVLQIMALVGGLGLIFGILGAIAGASGVGALGILAVSVMIVAIAAAFLILAFAAKVAGSALPSLAAGIVLLGQAIETISFSWEQLAKISVALLVLGAVVIPIALAFAIAAIALGVAFLFVGVGATMLAACLPALSEGLILFGEAVSSISFSWGQLGKLAVALLLLAVLGIPAAVGIAAAALILSLAFLVCAAALSLVSGIIPTLCTGIVMLVTTLVSMSSIAGQAAIVALQLMVAFIALGVGAIVLSVGILIAAVALIVASVAITAFSLALVAASIGIITIITAIELFAEGIALVSDLFTGGDMSSKVEGFSDKLKEGGGKITEAIKEVKDTVSEAAGGDGFDITSLFGGEGFDMSGLKDMLSGNIMEMFSGEGGLFGGDFSSMLGGDLMSGLTGGIEGMDTSQISSLLSDKLGGENGIDFTSVFSSDAVGAGVTQGITEGISNADMTAAGEELGDALAEGINNKQEPVKSAGETLGNSGKTGASGTRSEWISAGGFVGDGLVEGILSKLSAVYNAGYKLAKEGIAGANAGADNGSPSKIMMKVGAFMSEGLAIGIEDKAYMVDEASKNMVIDSIGLATELLAEAIENDYGSPVIRPTLDLSGVAEGASSISSLFGRQTIGTDLEDGNYANGSKSGTTYTYVQNNYSPKALNRIEIYRQTKNQINGSNVLANV